MSMMTRPTGIRCGNCQERHPSVDEVKACYRQSADAPAQMDSERTAEARNERHFEERYAGSEYGHEPHTAGYEMQRSWGREPEQKLEDGIYRNPQTGEIFKVYHTVHGRNVQVAKKLVLWDEASWYTKTVRGKQVTVKAEFEYVGLKGLKGLTASMRMTLAEAKEYGAIYGVCIRCAATLTKEVSIERAMGDTCAAKGNWA